MKPVYFVASLLGVAMAVPTQPRQSSELPRLVLYYQTTHDSNGRPVSILPLVTEKHIALTHLVVSSFRMLYPLYTFLFPTRASYLGYSGLHANII